MDTGSISLGQILRRGIPGSRDQGTPNCLRNCQTVLRSGRAAQLDFHSFSIRAVSWSLFFSHCPPLPCTARDRVPGRRELAGLSTTRSRRLLRSKELAPGLRSGSHHRALSYKSVCEALDSVPDALCVKRGRITSISSAPSRVQAGDYRTAVWLGSSCGQCPLPLLTVIGVSASFLRSSLPA